MENIYRGEPVSKQVFIDRLDDLKLRLHEDMMLESIRPEIVIEAANTLAKEIDQKEIVQQLIIMGIPKWTAEEYVKVTINSLEREELLKKVHTELGEEPFSWKTVDDGIEEKDHPLGVILHIGAGNALGLSAFSVLEGLLTGNINILKLPENEGGISSRILMRLAEIEPRLKPYIYVLDVSSRDREVIGKLVKIADAIVVWGSDEAVSAIRQLAPPSMPLIEWGHRLSFAYFTKKKDNEEDLQGLARDICTTDQLYCSSPQCVFYEADSPEELDGFASRLAEHIERESLKYPPAAKPINLQAQITLAQQLVKMEEILHEKRLITDREGQFSVMVDYNTELRTSPLFRNIWAMAVYRGELLNLLSVHRGHLQTVGLSCNEDELEELSKVFYTAGVNRITQCGYMSVTYSGEPHDGIYAMGRYVRKVNRAFQKKT